MRKLLVSDINDLRYQQEDYLQSKNNAQQNQDTDEDPVILKISLTYVLILHFVLLQN